MILLKEKFMRIETQRCLIRNFNKSDVYTLYCILSSPKVMEYIEPPFTEKKTKIFIENNALIPSPLVYALEYRNNNKLIGHVIFHEYDSKRYEIGWIISEEYWNQGIADEITKSLIDFARKKLIHSLIIECDPRQNKTIKLAIRNGFKLISDKELRIYELIL
ncbi:MAG: GNAT family N-acetyltransferase [Leptotrichia sp.]|jgi:hypothetical protein|nr:GNAT family N-acetyltransferase [Leptotrichia sp.]